MRRRSAASASASCARVLMPMASSSSSVVTAATALASATARADQVGEVILALGRERQARQRRPQPVGVEAVGAHVDLGEGELLGRGLGGLHHGASTAGGVAHHAAEVAQAGRVHAEQGERAGVGGLGLGQGAQGLDAQQRHIGVGDQHQVARALQRGGGLRHGVAGAQLARPAPT